MDDMRDWNNRVEKCPTCGKDVQRHGQAVPGRDVVFEYFACKCGPFTVVWNRADWNDNTLPDKAFFSIGYVVDDEPATAQPGEGGEDSL